MATQWIEVKADSVPDSVRFLVPAQNQGQIIEVAYGTFGRTENGPDDAPYKRVTNRSIGPEPRYYRAVR